jgi:hypothetical protein
VINSSPPAEILWVHRSVDAIGRNADGRRVIEYCDFHDTEPATLAPSGVPQLLRVRFSQDDEAEPARVALVQAIAARSAT